MWSLVPFDSRLKRGGRRYCRDFLPFFGGDSGVVVAGVGDSGVVVGPVGTSGVVVAAVGDSGITVEPVGNPVY